MYGHPEDVDGKCNAELHIYDDYGDGRATMKCQLDPNHEGDHREEFKKRDKPVTVTWSGCCRKEDEEFFAANEMLDEPSCGYCDIEGCAFCDSLKVGFTETVDLLEPLGELIARYERDESEGNC